MPLFSLYSIRCHPTDVTLSPSTPERILTYGNHFLLNCTLDLQPLNGSATYTWTYNGAILAYQNSAILSIPKVTTSHRGNYSCSALLHNVSLSSSNGVQLTVIGTWPVLEEHFMECRPVLGEHCMGCRPVLGEHSMGCRPVLGEHCMYPILLCRYFVNP